MRPIPTRAIGGRAEAAIDSAVSTLQSGRFRLLRRLGTGGMAEVYLAHDNALDIDRAIKILDPSMATQAQMRSRFENEARTLAKLQHPNIAGVVDVGVDGAKAYIVMEFIEGGTAMQRLERDGPLPPRSAAELTAAVLAALAHAHRAGIVHRDVKPANVLLTRDGTPKLADFGIAQIAGREITRTGAVMGTAAYMSPEQRLDSSSVGPPADLYAAGVLLYVLLTGREPLDLYNDGIRAIALRDLPGPLAEVIGRATRFDAAERYPDAPSMRDALLVALPALPEDPPDLPPLAARPAATEPQTVEDSATFAVADETMAPVPTMAPMLTMAPTTPIGPSSPPRWAPLAVGVGVAALAGISLAVWAGTRTVPPGPTPAPTTVEAPPAAEPAPLLEPEAPEPPAPVEPRAAARVAPAPAAPPTPAPIAAEPAAAVPNGRLFVSSKPKSRVVLDGQDRGTTPLNAQVPVGHHEVTLRVDGAEPIVRSLTVVEDAVAGFCWDFGAGAPCPR